MDDFPLWEIAEIPRNRIIQRMNLADVIEIAIKSKPFYDYLTANKLPAIELQWNLRQHYYLLLGVPFEKSWVQFYTEQMFPVPTRMRALRNAIRIVHGFAIGNHRDCEVKIKAIVEITKFLLPIINISGYSLQYNDVPGFDILKSSIFQVTKKFSKLSIAGNNATNLIEFTEEQLRFLLEDVKTENLDLKCKLKGLEKLENVRFNQTHLSIGSCSWIHPSVFLNISQLETIDVQFSYRLNLEDFIKVAVEWQGGEVLRSLKHLHFVNIEEWSETKSLVVREDLTLGVAPSDEDEFKDYKGIIQRFIDGKRAQVTVWNANDDENGHFFLSVEEDGHFSKLLIF